MKCKNCGCPFTNRKSGLCEWCERRGSFGISQHIIKPPLLNNERFSIINRTK